MFLISSKAVNVLTNAFKGFSVSDIFWHHQKGDKKYPSYAWFGPLIIKMELMESFSSVQINKQQLTLKQCPTRALGTQHC